MKGRKLALGLANLVSRQLREAYIVHDGLTLRPLKIGPHRVDDNASPSDLPSPLPSPYPGRRAAFNSKLEAELRGACAAVLLNTKPSHHYTPPAPKPALDYEAIKTSIDPRPVLPVTPPPGEKHPSRAYSYRPDATVDELFIKLDTHDTPMASRSKTPVAANVKSLTPDATLRPRVAKTVISPLPDATLRPHVTNRSLSGDTHRSTPHTDSTEYPWNSSTAPTSAAITPARTSKRASSQMPTDQDSTIKLDASAIEWMRNELERRRAAADEQPAPSTLSRVPSRTLGRSRSIRSLRDNIKEYIRPSTAGSASRDNSRPPSRAESSSSRRSDNKERDSDMRGGWRSWGRTLNVSRSNSQRGRDDTQKSLPKSEVDLNRELPPLPSLDQWTDTVAEPQESQTPILKYRAPTQKKEPIDNDVGEKAEIIADRLGSPARNRPEVYQTTRSFKSAAATKMPKLGAARSSDNLLPRSKSETFAHPTRPAPTVRAVTTNHRDALAQSAVSYPCLPSTYIGFCQHRNYDSSDIPSPISSTSGSYRGATHRKKVDNSTSNKPDNEAKYHRKMEVVSPRSPPLVAPSKESGDKKAWWNLKAISKKGSASWMNQLEKMGVKDGVLIDDENCDSPHIRY
jgi:hypothetical protein